MTEDIAGRLGAVVREVLDAPQLEITDDLTAADVDGWDSIAQVELIFAVEAEFGVSFPAEEITSFADVGDLRRHIEALLEGDGG